LALVEAKSEIRQKVRNIGNIAVVSMVIIYPVFHASQTKPELAALGIGQTRGKLHCAKGL